jgi:hypothetical protein
MADEWYYTQQGQQKGPVPTAQLKQLASSGRLMPTDLVWKQGMANWVPASNTRGLFPPAAAPVAAAPSPAKAPARRPPIFVEPIDDDEEEDFEDEAGRERRPRRRSKGLSTGAWVAIIGGSVGGLVLIGGVILLIVLLGGSGAVTGPRTFTDTVQPVSQQNYRVTFKAGQIAQFTIAGQGNTDVEIRVFDLRNTMVASSTANFTDKRSVSWTPPRTQTYRVELRNNGPFPNRLTITHN